MALDDAFAQRVVALHPLIFRWLRLFGIVGADSEDLAQQVLVQLFENASTVRYFALDQLNAYAYVATMHVAMDHVRARRRRAIRDRAWFDCQPTVRHERIIELLHARALVSALPESLARVLVLCEVHGFSLVDAAKAVDAPLGTVKTRLRKARALCRGEQDFEQSAVRASR